MPPSIPALYNARAPTYDTKTTFHRSLAAAYLSYASPRPGESLLDLACGTGLVTYNFAHVLQPSLLPQQPKVVGIDISTGMLDIARKKLEETDNQRLEITFLEHDITHLSDVDVVTEGEFDIITICSALVLLPDPSQSIKHWSKYLKQGGRMIVDVPHVKSMLSLKILSEIGPEFGVEVLGNRNWITGPESLRSLMDEAGMDGDVLETGIWGDIPAKTEAGRDSWSIQEGARIWEGVAGGFGEPKESERDMAKSTLTEGARIWDGVSDGFGGSGKGVKEKAKARFLEEWERLADADGLVREEGRLYIGVGRKR